METVSPCRFDVQRYESYVVKKYVKDLQGGQWIRVACAAINFVPKSCQAGGRRGLRKKPVSRPGCVVQMGSVRYRVSFLES